MAQKGPDRLEAEFIASAPSLALCPAPGGPEVAFAGRSNAGKSSTLNRLTGNRATAKVSKTPGRTRLLNFFAVRLPRMHVPGQEDGGLHGRIVDLPGYGYAKADRTAQARWQAAVNEYLSLRDTLVGVVLITDIRHPGQPLDLDVIEWALESGIGLQILLNKADKLKYGARQQALSLCRRQFAGVKSVRVQTFSALSGEGVPELLERLGEWFDTAREQCERSLSDMASRGDMMG